MSITQLSAIQLQDKLQKNDDLLLLDVRDINEFEYARIEGSRLIPLSLIPVKVNELDAEQKTVLICHHGMRSMQAAVYLENCGFTHLYNLQDGINAWSILCDNSVPQY